MQKQKNSHYRRYLNSVAVVVFLIGILFAFVRVRHHLLTVNNYFINIEDAEEVRSIVTSEFLVGETSKSDVENALNNRVFGDLDCRSFQYGGGSYISDSVIGCDALGSYSILFPRTYRITMGFSGGIFAEIEVTSFTDVP